MFTTMFLMLACSASTRPQPPIYQNPKAPLEARVRDLFSRLTQDEKMDILTGTAFTTRPIPRLGVPAMAMADAGQGVRGGMESVNGPATAFPSGVAMASTWDPELVGRIGAAIGQEALNKGTGVQCLLGPAVNIHRSPLGGRNGEYFSEDPYLAARLAVGYIKGMQSTGCAATVKHFAANNEEVDRSEVNVRVSERALREIYLPAFEASVKEGNVWAVMSSYNRLNGYHASANYYLLNDILKKCWGYTGMVMSDWGGVHETVGAINAGNDVEMPGPGYLKKENIARELKRGTITQKTVDENVIRILRTVIRVGLLNAPHTPDHKVVDSPAHRRLTIEAASKGIVLLKNQNGLLPINRDTVRSIAIIGGPAKNMQVGADGSPNVTPFYKVQPFDGIKNASEPGTEIRYAPGSVAGSPVPASVLSGGWKAEYFNNRELQGAPVLTQTEPSIRNLGQGSPVPGLSDVDYSIRWKGKLIAPKTGKYRFTLTADDGCRMFVDGKAIVNEWHVGGETDYVGSIDMVEGHTYDLRVEYYQQGGAAAFRFNWLTPGIEPFGDAVQAAKNAEYAVVCVSTMGQESEGTDRPSLDLARDQDALIQAVAAVNKRTIVVLNNGTPVDMRAWVNKVPGIIETFFPGQEGGTALASVLYGDVNPSGKLPDTFGFRREDYPDYGNFPGVKNVVNYKEGIYVGYRHFDKKGIQPLFPFGYGLSYTTFRYGAAHVSAPAADGSRTATLKVTNAGKRTGAEVVELYTHDLKPKVDRPIRELKGFKKIELAPGQSKTVTFKVRLRDLAYCDVPGKQWKANAGSYELQIGASSRDIRQRVGFTLKKDYKEPIPYMQDQMSLPVEQDLALGRPVTASSIESRTDIGDLGPQSAVDGDDGTRWSSGSGVPQWISVDLGAAKKVARVDIRWEDAYATAFSIETSLDGTTWSKAYSTEQGTGGAQSFEFPVVSARYVRMVASGCLPNYGVSLYSLGVFAHHHATSKVKH